MPEPYFKGPKPPRFVVPLSDRELTYLVGLIKRQVAYLPPCELEQRATQLGNKLAFLLLAMPARTNVYVHLDTVPEVSMDETEYNEADGMPDTPLSWEEGEHLASLIQGCMPEDFELESGY